jgi:hypothetical protein
MSSDDHTTPDGSDNFARNINRARISPTLGQPIDAVDRPQWPAREEMRPTHAF